MRARAAALPSDEIPVGRRGAALAGRHRLAIGAEAKRAAGLAPLEPGLQEDLVQPFGLGLLLDEARSPGTTQASTPGCTLRPFTTAAAARRSSMRALVQEPMKTRSTGIPDSGVPGVSPI